MMNKKIKASLLTLICFVIILFVFSGCGANNKETEEMINDTLSGYEFVSADNQWLLIVNVYLENEDKAEMVVRHVVTEKGIDTPIIEEEFYPENTDGSNVFALILDEPGYYEVEASCPGYNTEKYLNYIDTQKICVVDITPVKAGEQAAE